MEYENPEIPEGINVSPRNHLIDFLVLTVGAFVVILILTLILGIFAGYLAKKIPFETELSFSGPFENIQDDISPEKNDYLKNLVATIATCSDLPEGMHIKYHYQDSDVVNAFATLGGNLVLFQGLIDELDNENELAMIVAHEIAHIKNRHPIQSIGRAVIIGISFSLIIGNSATNPLEKSGLLTLLKFSRNMESEADNDGLRALNKCYGHVNGAVTTFEKFQQQEHIHPLPFLSTHPLNNQRISNIRSQAIENNWKTDGRLIMFPEFM